MVTTVIGIIATLVFAMILSIYLFSTGLIKFAYANTLADKSSNAREDSC